MNWTEEQKQVIESKDQTLLVSAAAGSGKTAVLVERVIQKILRQDDPVDIDRMLIVTFTRAAAGEMKERILAAITKALEAQPENEHLQRQMAYIHNANITTIHSFCLQLVKEHFHELAVDPGFRVGEEGEIRLLQGDVLQNLLEECYEKAEPSFLQFVEQYADGKTDEFLEELILGLYEFSQSYPWPEQWLETCVKAYEKQPEGEGLPPFVSIILKETEERGNNLIAILDKAIHLCREEGGPVHYEEALLDDRRQAEEIVACAGKEDFDGIVSFMKGQKFQPLSRKRVKNLDEGIKKEVQALRSVWKDEIEDLKKTYYYQTLKESLSQMAEDCPAVETLADLVRQFTQCYEKEKREKNLVDFHDLEHMALQILVERDACGKVTPTVTAREIARDIHEIMIDEYQDSNLVQDYILSSISGEPEGRFNRFMVGDVKQSIYRFRMAKPELFLDKLEHYGKESAAHRRKIVLGRNFRSRSRVLSSINTIFFQIMGKATGGVSYDEEAALYAGAEYPDVPEGQDDRTELLLLTEDETLAEENQDADTISAGKEPEGSPEDGEAEEETNQIREARLVAKRIKELLAENYQVTDKATGEFRPVEYGDIVILLRSIVGWGEVMTDVLLSEGIPAYCETAVGYFNTMEVRTVLDFLAVIDNPRNDVPLAGVLHSPIFGVTNTELAVIRTEAREEYEKTGDIWDYYDCVRYYLEHGKRMEIREKLRAFADKRESYRRASVYMGMEELLTFVLTDTGYYDYVTAMPSGERRRANLDVLRVKAEEFENGSYRGLFRFIHYIRQLRKYEVDYGEAPASDGESAVRIMSIHKSKGLEFPVVFVSGLGKNFNLQDTAKRIVLHSELGIGAAAVNDELRMTAPTLLKNVISKRIRQESLGEELRILYVALTRAKEKLILTGCAGKMEQETSRADRWLSQREEPDVLLPAYAINGAGGLLDWIGLSIIRTKAAKPIYDKRMERLGSRYMPVWHKLFEKGEDFLVRVIPYAALNTVRKKEREITADIQIDEWSRRAKSEGNGIKEQLKSLFAGQKEDSLAGTMPAKLSVSEIKHKYMEDEEAVFVQDMDAIGQAKEHTASGSLSGAARGTAYHKVMELWQYDRGDSIEDIRRQMDEIAMEGHLNQEELESILPGQIQTFLRSGIGRRMKAAFERGTLKREQQFVMSVPAETVLDNYQGEETILVQGMMDACLEEDGEMVILDYKTDRVHAAEELVRRYQVQLALYKTALEGASGKNVKETWIYSFHLGEEIRTE